MINTNLLITTSDGSYYTYGFGGSAYEQLVAHDNLMSGYIEIDGGYSSIPYHAVDAVAIVKMSAPNIAIDANCPDDRFCTEIMYCIEESATGTNLHDGDTVECDDNRYYFFYPFAGDPGNLFTPSFTATISDPSLATIVELTADRLEIKTNNVAGTGDIVFTFPEYFCSWTIHFTVTP